MIDDIFSEADSLIEINNLQLSLAIEGDVGWLDITMCNTHRFQIVKALGNLIHNFLDQLVWFVLEEDALDILEASLLAGLKDEKKLIFFADHEVDKVDDTRIG